MGRSFARVLPENTPQLGKPFYHKESQSYFAMIARNGELYQRRWQIGFDGKETNVDEKQADFVVPSRASRFLCGTGPRLPRERLAEGNPVFRGGGPPGADRVPSGPAWQRAHGKPAVPRGGSSASARDWPGSRRTVGVGTLGWVLWQADKGADARTALERAVALDPDVPEVHNNLANVAWGTGDQAVAEQQFREVLRIQPGIADWRLNLARVLATRGEMPEARFQFEQAIRLRPDSAEARLDYGRLLADHSEFAAAIRQLETAVRLKPDLWRAHFELGIALGRSGNPAAATEQMKIAAGGSDPQVRAEAADGLQRLRR